ncbi:MAG: glycosyltransferase [Calothrix sp. MO_192.B10]|nr:glycosyltransferase [Calothrix sp. MO_192.B10]
MGKESSHIAIYLHSIFNGGVDRIMVNLSRGFIERGIKVDLVVDSPGLLHLWDWPPEVRIVDLKASKNILPRFSKLVDYLRQEKPTALLAGNHYSNEIAVLAKLMVGISTKIVVVEQISVSTEANSKPIFNLRHWTPLFIKFLYPRADGIVVASQGVAKDLVNVTGLSKERFRVIYNPVLSPVIWEKAKEPIDHPWFTPGDVPVIMAAGRLEKQKDFPTLIKAFAQVRRLQPVRLVIFGGGSQKPQLQELVRELSLENDVSFPGFVKNPYAYVTKSALLASSSAWEGLPTFLIETMALGIPIVSTNCPSGPAEILDNGKYGELVPVGDSKALAEGIVKVLSGQSKSVVPSWLEQFTIQNAVQKYLDVMGIQE